MSNLRRVKFMKTHQNLFLSLVATMGFASSALAQGTAFTYQGRLNDGTGPANGSYDLRFGLFDAASGGTQQGGTITNVATAVSNGLFTVPLNFGANFPGANRWLEIAVRTNGGSPFITLNSRQQITSSPYAITAGSANGLPGLTVQQNTNGAPDVIGGSQNNYVSRGVVGATIAGGGATNYFGSSYTNGVTADFGTVGGGWNNNAGGFATTVGGGYFNNAGGYAATVGGGVVNTASGSEASIGGGGGNTASGQVATIAGGQNSAASGQYATVGGGYNNIAGGNYATAGGGVRNYANASYSTVSGGINNLASGTGATVAGGTNNKAAGAASFAAGVNAQALHDGSFVWADGTSGTFASTTNNQFSIRAQNGVRIQAPDSRLRLESANSGLYAATEYVSTGRTRHTGVGGPAAFSDAANNFYIYDATAAKFRFVVTTNGNVGIGTATPSSLLEVAGGITTASGIDIHGHITYRQVPFGGFSGTWNVGISSTANFGFTADESFGQCAFIDTSGNYWQVSDRSIKRDISSLENSLDRLMQLRAVSYHFRNEPKNTPVSLGFVAQEVQPIFPEVVREQSNGVKAIGYSELIPVTIRSIQELNQKVEAGGQKSEDRIQKLEAENAELKARLEKLERLMGDKQIWGCEVKHFRIQIRAIPS
jgi:hypothetical protein